MAKLYCFSLLALCIGVVLAISVASTSAVRTMIKENTSKNSDSMYNIPPPPPPSQFSTCYYLPSNPPGSRFIVKSGVLDIQNGIAWGYLTNQIPTTGWSRLSIATSPTSKLNPEILLYGAGYLEVCLLHIYLLLFFFPPFLLFNFHYILFLLLLSLAFTLPPSRNDTHRRKRQPPLITSFFFFLFSSSRVFLRRKSSTTTGSIFSTTR